MIAVKKTVAPLVVGSMILFSSGCANMPDMSKATTGAIGGAVAGAAVGAQVGGARGALVGAVIGGVIGNQIGNYLDENDKKKMAELEMKALSSGKAQSFVANKSKEKVTITPGPTTRETLATYSLSPNLTNHTLEIAAKVEIVAFVDTPLYSDTNLKQAPRMVMKKGEKLVVPATVSSNARWGAVVEGETVIGYVPVSYLDKKTARAYAPPKAIAKAKAAIPPTPAVATSTPKAPAGELIAVAAPADAQAQIQKASMVGNCKISVRHVKDTTENLKYCIEPPKGWQPVKA